MSLALSCRLLNRGLRGGRLRRAQVWHYRPDSDLIHSRLSIFNSTVQARHDQPFSSSAPAQQDVSTSTTLDLELQSQKRKPSRPTAGKRSLRRVAVEAERSRDPHEARETVDGKQDNRSITAICAAEEYDMSAVVRILRFHGYPIDPTGTGFLDEQVVHTRTQANEDIFVFPSGTLVSWAIPESRATELASVTLLPATINPNVQDMEIEDLDYNEDPNRDHSNIKGDVIVLGTKSIESNPIQARDLDTTLVKIAFSSGLARSTKLAVLETMLSKYFDSTRAIPQLLSKGSRLPFSRSFLLQKTGELLELRAQLNHYSELTDSLPDLFWDSRHELGLEGYYDQVGKALDVGIRIKTLNQKMDYAQEISTILRGTLSEKHSIHLEWIIIILIAVEVGFELRRLWKERQERLAGLEQE